MLRLLAATLAIGAARATDDAPAAAVADGPHPYVLRHAAQTEKALTEAVASVDQGSRNKEGMPPRRPVPGHYHRQLGEAKSIRREVFWVPLPAW